MIRNNPDRQLCLAVLQNDKQWKRHHNYIAVGYVLQSYFDGEYNWLIQTVIIGVSRICNIGQN